MNRPVVAEVLLGLFFAVGFCFRVWRHWRMTGSTGIRRLSGRPGSAEWLGGVLFVAGCVLAFAAPITNVSIPPSPFLSDRAWWLDAAALGAMVVGIAGTAWAQLAMGSSWRIGVQADERTELVERGPFRWVRNPIFSFMLVAAAGLALLLVNAPSIVAFVCLCTGIELQVRFAEEP